MGVTTTTAAPVTPGVQAVAPRVADADRTWVDPVDVRGFTVVSGTGEELGHVVGIERDRDGVPKWLAFREGPDGPPRRVQLRFVRRFGHGRVELAGPRQGYHMTRLGSGPCSKRPE